MNTIKIVIHLAFMSFLIGCSPSQHDSSLNNQYGVLRIPIPNGCNFDSDSLTIPSIEKAEVVNFDMAISGMNTSSFMHVKHKGYPSDVLNPLSRAIAHCIPNAYETYDSSVLLFEDLERYKLLSVNQDIYITIHNGKFIVSYMAKK